MIDEDLIAAIALYEDAMTLALIKSNKEAIDRIGIAWNRFAEAYPVVYELVEGT